MPPRNGSRMKAGAGEGHVTKISLPRGRILTQKRIRTSERLRRGQAFSSRKLELPVFLPLRALLIFERRRGGTRRRLAATSAPEVVGRNVVSGHLVAHGSLGGRVLFQIRLELLFCAGCGGGISVEIAERIHEAPHLLDFASGV